MPLLPHPRATLGTAALYLAGGVVCAAPLAIGGVSSLAHVVLTSLALLSLSLHVADRALERRALAISWTGAIFALALVASLLTLLPLPQALRATLDPRSTELKIFIGEALPSSALGHLLPVLAADPPEAALGVLRLIMAGSVFVVIGDRARRPIPRDRLYRLLIGGGALVLLVSVFHRFANLNAIYGVVEVPSPGGLYGPLVNPNQLGRVFGAFALLAVAYLAHARSRREELGAGLAAAALAGGVVLTYSWGGILAFGAVVVIAAALHVLDRASANTDHAPTRGRAWPPLLALTGVGLLLWLTREALVSEVVDHGGMAAGISKTALYRPTLRLVMEHGWLGVGTGGFRTALPSLLSVGELSSPRFTHVENIVLETLVSHGIILGTGLLAVAGATGWHLFRRLQTPALRGPLLALAFLLLGDLFDFSLQTPAGLLLAATALGLASASAMSAGAPIRRLRPRKAWAMLAILTAVAAASAVIGYREDRRRTDAELAELTGAEHAERTARAMASHPLDPWYAYLLSRDARRQRDANRAIRWANRAILLDPNSGPAHVEAARVLWADGRVDQALTEYRLAWASTHSNWQRLVDEVAARTPSLELRLRAGDGSQHSYSAICRRVGAESRRQDAADCWRRALEAFPESPRLRQNAADAALHAGRPKEARKLVEPLLSGPTVDGETVKLWAASLAHDEGLEAAFLKATATRQDVRRSTWPLDWWLLGAARRLGRHEQAQVILQRARRGATHEQRQKLDGAEADLLERMGRKTDALMLWRSISAANPRNVDALNRQATLELALGMKERARLSLGRLEAVAPASPAVKRLRSRLAPADKDAGTGGGQAAPVDLRRH